MTPGDGLVTCDYCQSPRPVTEVYPPYPGAVRCRDTEACGRRQLYMGSNMKPPCFDRPAPVSAGGPVRCDYCRTSRPAAELYQPVPNGVVHRCRDTAACQRRAVDTIDLTAQRESFRTAYTSAEMRAAAAGMPEVPARPGQVDFRLNMPSAHR